MNPAWCREFVGMPYKEGGCRRNNDGYDCWGLVRAIYDHVFSVDVGDWTDEVGRNQWRALSVHQTHKEGDLLVFTPDGVCHHVGLVASPGRMIHAAENLGQVIIEPYRSALWKTQLKRAYRHSGLN